MDVYLEIAKALVEMVKQGGTLAIWGIFVWLILGIVKTGIVLCFLAWVVRLVVFGVSNYHTLRFLNRKDNIQLLSKKCSKDLVDLVRQYQNDTTQAMKDFMKDAKDLLKPSKEIKK